MSGQKLIDQLIDIGETLLPAILPGAATKVIETGVKVVDALSTAKELFKGDLKGKSAADLDKIADDLAERTRALVKETAAELRGKK